LVIINQPSVLGKQKWAFIVLSQCKILMSDLCLGFVSVRLVFGVQSSA